MALHGRRIEHDAWTAFGLGVLGGVIGGLSLISWAGILAVALIAIIGGLGLRPRPFGAAGVLLGWGAAWMILLAGAQTRCDPASCAAPDLGPWTAVALGIAATGAGLVIVGIRRPAWTSGLARGARAVSRRRPVRIGVAAVVGAIAGLYASTLLAFGWATAIPIWCWFAWRHRGPDRRAEIVWLTAAAVASFVVLVRR